MNWSTLDTGIRHRFAGKVSKFTLFATILSVAGDAALQPARSVRMCEARLHLQDRLGAELESLWLPVPPIPLQCMLKDFLTVEKIPACIAHHRPGNTMENQKQNLCLSEQGEESHVVCSGGEIRAGCLWKRERLLSSLPDG